MPDRAPSDFRRVHARLIGRLFGASEAAKWNLSEDDFAAALERSSASRFRDAEPAPGEIAGYLETLRLDDLALALACEHGRAEAWEHFILNFRPLLYRSARAVAADESLARELADSIWADLYGLVIRNEKRRSLLSYFHGRSSLAGWLRALIARRLVDVKRATRRTDSLAPEEADRIADPSPSTGSTDPERGRYVSLLNEALAAAISGLAPRERLRLSLYYQNHCTLAEIGRAMGEHESTVSRRLERARQEIRKAIDRSLRREQGLSDEQVRLCHEYATGEWPYDPGSAFESGARNRAGSVPGE